MDITKFLLSHHSEIRTAIASLEEVNEQYHAGEIDDAKVENALGKTVENKYDREVSEFINNKIGSNLRSIHPDEIIMVCARIEERHGTEPQMAVFAINEFCSFLGIRETRSNF